MSTAKKSDAKSIEMLQKLALQDVSSVTEALNYLREKGKAQHLNVVFESLKGAERSKQQLLVGFLSDILDTSAVEAFIDRQIDHDLVQEAFAEFSSPGRLQILKRNPTIVIDAAHNPAGIRATKQGINESFQFDNLILILAFMGDKDIDQILEELKGFAQIVILTQTKSARALSIQDLEKKVRNITQFANRVEVSDNSEEAIKLATKLANEVGNSAGIIALGSVVLAGEIGSLLKGGKNN